MHRTKAISLIAAIVGSMAIVGCSTPKHTDLLVFGTATTTGLDISAADTTGKPAITIGYRRLEVVLMPLVVNNRGAETTKNADGSVTTGKTDYAENQKYIGAEGANNRDTYSVLASFGTKMSAGAPTGNLNGGVQIAQFFATGLAARTLAGSGPGLISTSSEAAKAAPQVAAANSSAAQLTAVKAAITKNSLSEEICKKLLTENGDLNDEKVTAALTDLPPISGGGPVTKEVLKSRIGDAKGKEKENLRDFLNTLPSAVHNKMAENLKITTSNSP